MWMVQTVAGSLRIADDLESSGLLRAGDGFEPMDRAFAGRFPFGFRHVRRAIPELQACRQTLATAARG